MIVNLDAVRKHRETYKTSHAHNGAFACCAAHACAEDVPPLLAEVAHLRAQLAEIRHLHTDSPTGFCPSCFRPDDMSDTDDGLVAWPCPTLRAMGIKEANPR